VLHQDINAGPRKRSNAGLVHSDGAAMFPEVTLNLIGQSKGRPSFCTIQGFGDTPPAKHHQHVGP
jgi:hypothetical protein